MIGTIEQFDQLAEDMAGAGTYDQRYLRSRARMVGMKFKNTKANTDALISGLKDATWRMEYRANPTPLPMSRLPKMTGDLNVVTPTQTEVVKNPTAYERVVSLLNGVRIGLRPRRNTVCPPSPIEKVQRPTLPGDFAFPVAVLSDLHVPFHDGPFIDRMIDHCVYRGVRSFILAGDITDNNQWNKRTHDVRTERKWQDDVDLARSVLAHICASLGPGYVFFGNHDEWIMKATRGQMDTNWLYQHLFPDIPVTFSFKHQVLVPYAGGGKPSWLIVHGERYSHGNPMGVVEKYALHSECNVIMGHQHYASQWKSGSYNLIMNGGLMSYERMDYMVERPQPMRQQQRGFSIIDESGDATLYTEYQTWR